MPSFLSSVVATVRQNIVTAARWGIENEPRIHYGQVRPMPLTRRLPLTTDCSGFATLCYYLAGAPDPNGLGYSGQGWTGTLLLHLEAIPARAARAGDLVVFGAYPGRHVALVLEPGEDPLLCSHGQERGPVAIRFSAECRYQPATVTWLTAPAPRRAARDESGGAGEETARRPESAVAPVVRYAAEGSGDSTGVCRR